MFLPLVYTHINTKSSHKEKVRTTDTCIILDSRMYTEGGVARDSSL